MNWKLLFRVSAKVIGKIIIAWGLIGLLVWLAQMTSDRFGHFWALLVSISPIILGAIYFIILQQYEMEKNK